MERRTLLIKNISICGCQTADILINNGLIAEIGTGLKAAECTVLDGTGKVAIPGFINMHTHSAMSFMRGTGEDMLFKDWIGKIWDLENVVSEEYVYWGTRIAALEMIKSGTTTFNDHYWFPAAAAKAAAEMGINAVIPYNILDRFDPVTAAHQREAMQRTLEESASWAEGISFGVSVHSIYTVSEEMLLWSGEFARKHGLQYHIHVSETEKEVIDCKNAHGGLSPVEYLNELGLLSEKTTAAHTLWLSEHDIELLGSNRVTCVHNINSNTKLASGYRFLYNELRDAGANICLGTDGCASSNNLDMLETMKTSALIQKAWRNDPTAMPLDELMDCATANAGKLLNTCTKLNGCPGSISVGARADICIVNTDNASFLSPAPFLANLIYSAHSDCIETVIAGGRIVMQDRKVPGEQELIRNAKVYISKVYGI